MKRHTVRQRLAAVFLAALMSLSCLPPLPAFAEDGIAETVSAAETDFSVSEDEATPETAKTESNSGEDVTSESGSTQNEKAQAFVDAVTALDRESILSAVNTWALASQAWQAEKDNPDLTAALEIATAASDEAAAPVYAAENLYNSLTDEERAQETVQNAYSALAALIVTPLLLKRAAGTLRTRRKLPPYCMVSCPMPRPAATWAAMACPSPPVTPKSGSAIGGTNCSRQTIRVGWMRRRSTPTP